MTEPNDGFAVFMRPDGTMVARGRVRGLSVNGVACRRIPGTDEWEIPQSEDGLSVFITFEATP